jgi:hypothetical protein
MAIKLITEILIIPIVLSIIIRTTTSIYKKLKNLVIKILIPN